MSSGRITPELVDAQVHVWDRDHPGRPWDPGRRAARAKLIGAGRAADDETPVTAEEMVGVMDRLGIAAAVLVATSHYGWDNGYSLEATAAHPGRFSVVGRVDPAAPDVADEVERWRAEPAAAGLRILLMTAEHHAQLEGGHFDALLAAAERFGVPVSVFPPGHGGDVARIARRYPGLQILVDHLGLRQPPLLTPDDPPFRSLPELLSLADHPNVAVKLTGLPSLSGEPFPYRDLWPALHRVIEAFGAERVCWGTDWPRLRPLCDAEAGVAWIADSDELSPAEKALVLGANTRRLLASRAAPSGGIR